MSNLPDPVRISPLIKFTRYSLLIAGIFYGAVKKKTFQVIEAGRKDERDQKRAEREARIAREKQAANERDIAEIVAIFTPKPKLEISKHKTSNVEKDNSRSYAVHKIDENIRDGIIDSPDEIKKDFQNSIIATPEKMLESGDDQPSDSFSNPIDLTMPENIDDEENIFDTETVSVKFNVEKEAENVKDDNNKERNIFDPVKFSVQKEAENAKDQKDNVQTNITDPETFSTGFDVPNEGDNIQQEGDNTQQESENDSQQYFVETFSDGIPYTILGSDNKNDK